MGFIASDLSAKPASVAHFYNGRGTAEHWTEEERYPTKNEAGESSRKEADLIRQTQEKARIVEADDELLQVPCFNSAWRDCEGEIEFCPTLGATLCKKHHALVHEEEHCHDL